MFENRLKACLAHGLAVIAGGVVGLSILAQPAAAAAVTSGNLTYEIAPGSCVGAACAGLQLQAVGTNGIRITGAGALVTNDDVSFQLWVTALTGTISSWASLIDTGGRTGSAGETIADGPGSGLGSLLVDNTAPYASTTFAAQTFLSIDKDINGLGGSVLSLTQAPTIAVPEPASLALFGAGLAALAGLRRRNRAA